MVEFFSILNNNNNGAWKKKRIHKLISISFLLRLYCAPGSFNYVPEEENVEEKEKRYLYTI